MAAIEQIIASLAESMGIAPNVVWLGILGIVVLVIGLGVAYAVRAARGAVGSKEVKLTKAAALVKKKDHLGAATLFAQMEMWDHAASQYIKAEKYVPALDAARKSGKRDVLMFCLGKTGGYMELAEMLEESRQFVKAANAYLKAGKLAKAGELYLQEGDWKKAMQVFMKAKLPEKAGRAAAKGKDFEAASKIFLNTHRNSEGTDYVKFGVLASDALTKIGKRELALKLLIDCNREKEAKEYAEKYSMELMGTKLAKEAGNHDLASYFISKGGDPRQAARVKAAGLEDQDPFGAAQLYVEAGDYLKAGKLFELSGYVEEAADQYMQAEAWPEATRLLVKNKEYGRAAQAYNRAGDYENAGIMFERAGDPAKALTAFQKGRIYDRAVKIARSLNQTDKALEILALIPNDHPSYKQMLLIKGDLLAANKRFDAAKDALKAGLEGADVSADTIGSWYLLGRLHEQSGKRDLAVNAYKRIIAFNSGYKDVAKRLDAMGAGAANDSGQTPAQVPAQPAGNERYVMLQEVGRGGMGIVSKALDTQLDRVVAYKVLPEELRHNQAAVKNFLREARAAASLTHPNVVIVHDMGETPKEVYLVMEFLEGKTLKQYIRGKGKIDPKIAVKIASEIAAGLHYAHEKRLIHRDIKSSNIMLTSEGGVKIMDFGLAKIIREVANNQTIVGGTPYYMSPEQVKGGQVGPSTDLYALGCTLFEMLTGRVPFTEGDIAYQHVHNEPPKVTDIDPEVPEGFVAILDRLLQKDPAKRIQSGAELIEKLKAVPLS